MTDPVMKAYIRLFCVCFSLVFLGTVKTAADEPLLVYTHEHNINVITPPSFRKRTPTRC